VPADLSDHAEAARVVREVEEALGPVDVLISCAGGLHRDWVEDVTVEDFEESYRTGVGAAIWLTQQVLPGMRVRGFGRIVLVSSGLGLIGGPTYTSYSTTKFALIGLAEVDPARVARSIEAAASGSGTVVVIDRPHMRLFYKLPRKLRQLFVADAFKKLLRARERHGVES
jgi:NAD(P)-dependent dehydrogenase (short-subunit alcohol dehydrogenase family)